MNCSHSDAGKLKEKMHRQLRSDKGDILLTREFCTIMRIDEWLVHLFLEYLHQ